MASRFVALFALPFLAAMGGCLANQWAGGKTALVNDEQVAIALGDGPSLPERFDPESLPMIPPPQRTRPCCAFGMDLQMSVAGQQVPGYSMGNILGAGELGRHEYDNGAITLNQDLGRLVTVENNGLVYTCRGGFIDTAHVRDNADLTLYLTMQIITLLPKAGLVKLEGDGATRRVALKAVPTELIDQLGRWEVAITLAQWASFQISIWHEIVTWYGHESFPGFSEKVSAFSIEDLYSNALGTRIAGGILRNQRVRSRADWDEIVAAWLDRALARLAPLSADLGRRAMKSVDGRWWDSQKKLPDWTLVRRRNFDLGPRVRPWRIADADLPDDPVLSAACAEASGPLPLDIPQHLGNETIHDLVTVDFEVESWAPATFPFPDPQTRRLTSTDLPRVVEAVRQEAKGTFGAGFDHPASPLGAKAP